MTILLRVKLASFTELLFETKPTGYNQHKFRKPWSNIKICKLANDSQLSIFIAHLMTWQKEAKIHLQNYFLNASNKG